MPGCPRRGGSIMCNIATLCPAVLGSAKGFLTSRPNKTALSRTHGLKHEVSTSQTSGHIAERKHKPRG